MTGKIGGGFDEDFYLLTAARQLGIRWDEIADTPAHVLELAWENWLAERNALNSRPTL